MNFRKFYFILTIIVSVFLFTGGVMILNYISTNTSEANSNLLGDLMGNYMVSKTPFNVLVLGGDKVNKNTDTMMLVNYNPSTSKVSIMSIPRDTKVTIEGRTRKINFAYPHGGADLVVQTVSELLDVNVKYYVYVDTKAFRQIIDILGGVDFDVPVDMNYDDSSQNLHIHLKKGMQHLDGEKAEGFMRFRKPNYGHYKGILEYYDGSDLKRIDAQHNFITALIKQKANVYYLPKLNEVINVVYENLETNITLNEVTGLAKGLKDFSSDSTQMLTLPGTTEDGGSWYYVCDSEKASEIIDQYFTADGTYTIKSSGSNSESQDNTGTKTSGKSSKTSGKKKDVTKGNPSNSHTTIKGTTKQIP